MANTSTNHFGVPGITAGILHPKMLNKFVVAFRGVPRRAEDAQHLTALMQNATMQTVSVQLPTLMLTSRQAGRGTSSRFTYNDKLVFVMEEDVTNNILSFIHAVADGSFDWLSIAVCELDGSEFVLSAYDFPRVKILTSKKHELTYYSPIYSLNGQIADAIPNSKGNPTNVSNLTAKLDNGKNHTAAQTITAMNDKVDVYCFKDKHPTLTDFLKGLN